MSAPSCAACGQPAVVHRQRRPTVDEIAVQQKIEQDRRNQILLLADPQLPTPNFPPMPDLLDATVIVTACAQDAILDVAALIHQASCTAPPTCTCTPEPLPQPARNPHPSNSPPGGNHVRTPTAPLPRLPSPHHQPVTV